MLGYLRANNSQIFTYRLFAIDCNNAIHWSNHVSMDNIFGFVTTFIQPLFALREAAFSLLQISTRIGAPSRSQRSNMTYDISCARFMVVRSS